MEPECLAYIVGTLITPKGIDCETFNLTAPYVAFGQLGQDKEKFHLIDGNMLPQIVRMFNLVVLFLNDG